VLLCTTSSVQFQRTLQRFKTHSLVLMALLFTVRIAMFAVVYSLLQSQQEQVRHTSKQIHVTQHLPCQHACLLRMYPRMKGIFQHAAIVC
jgi:hypothetical protein